MPGYLPGGRAVAGLPGNHDRGLLASGAPIARLDEEPGAPPARMDGSVITAVRPALDCRGGRARARPRGREFARRPRGRRARAIAPDAFPRLFELDDIRVASRDRRHAETPAGSHPKARVVDSFEEAVRGADLVCCCTDADEPVLSHAWIARGAHVSSVGGAPRWTRQRSARRRSSSRGGAAENSPPTGSAELQGLDPASIAEIGEVLAGVHPDAGRTRVDAVQVDRPRRGGRGRGSTGLRSASADGVGTTFEL